MNSKKEKQMENAVGAISNRPHFKGKTQKGITLIALVITIIVLLILAGVTISMVLGDDGIIANAQAAKKANEEANSEEEEERKDLEADMNLQLYPNGNPEEVKINGNDTTLKKAVEESLKNTSSAEDATKQFGSLEELSASAETNGYLIKLNQTTYLSKEIRIAEKKNVVIDLNGNKLVCSEGAMIRTTGMPINQGYIYIIDNSSSQTGKVEVLQKVNEQYTYDEKYDLNSDGIISGNDLDVINERI